MAGYVGKADYGRNKDQAFAVIRERQKRFGDVHIPETRRCVVCTPKQYDHRLPPPGISILNMARIPTTGIVSNVQDCVCAKCASSHKDLARHARIVCAGCREVVLLVEPQVEKTGFTWKPGGFYHVVECPTCAKDKRMAKSDIAEKVLYYKTHGIPYAP